MRWPWSKIETKRSAAMMIPVRPADAARWSERHYRSFAREGYQTNVIVQSAIRRIADAVATIDWIVELNGRPVKDHPLEKLMRQPNPLQSGAEWWRMRISYLYISGNCYNERVMMGNTIRELWALRPDRMTVIPGRAGIPSAFEYKVGGEKVIFPVDPSGDSDIRHTKLFHPTDDWYGMSPIESAAYAIDQHNEAMNWIQGLLQNSARPSGALVLGADAAISDEEFNRIKGEIEERYSGGRNAGRPMLLEGGLDWKQMGLSPMDMEVLRTKDSAARDISLAFGVPPLLLNIPGDNTYANYREARLGFYEDTVIPFITYEIEELNSWLSPYFGGARLRPDMDKIEAIAEKHAKRWTMANESDDLTLNESRAMKGLPPLPEPLGSTLMCEIRAGANRREQPEVEETIKELGYGTVD